MSPIPVITENIDFIVADKPPGLETISQNNAPELTRLLREARNEPALAPAHRLDRDTSGAQLLARNPSAEAELVSLFRRREMGKIYLAVCVGIPKNRTGLINRNLSEWSGGHRPVRVLKHGGLKAETTYRLLASAILPAESLPLGLVAFSPHQGRTHQIRVHAAAFGYPILGDDQYGDRAANRTAKNLFGLTRQALHSLRLDFSWRGSPVRAFCPPAPDILAVAEAAFGETVTANLDAIFP